MCIRDRLMAVNQAGFAVTEANLSLDTHPDDLGEGLLASHITVKPFAPLFPHFLQCFVDIRIPGCHPYVDAAPNHICLLYTSFQLVQYSRPDLVNAVSPGNKRVRVHSEFPAESLDLADPRTLRQSRPLSRRIRILSPGSRCRRFLSACGRATVSVSGIDLSLESVKLRLFRFRQIPALTCLLYTSSRKDPAL